LTGFDLRFKKGKKGGRKQGLAGHKGERKEER